MIFVRIKIPTAANPNDEIRLVHWNRHVEAFGVWWQRVDANITLPEENVSGALGTATITVPNVSRIVTAYVEAGELLGRTMEVYLQHESDLTDLVTENGWQMTILNAEGGELDATLEAGHPAEIMQIPQTVYTREEYPQLLPTAGVTL